MAETPDKKDERREALRLKSRLGYAAARVRALSSPTPEDAALIQAAVAIRMRKGAARASYPAHEVELLARARKIAFNHGHLKIARILVLRSEADRSADRVPHVRLESHLCPRCGHRHRPYTGVQVKPAAERRELEGMEKRLRQLKGEP